MSGFDNNYSGNKDIRKLLGNPKITFVLGTVTFADQIRRTCFRKRNLMC